MIEPVSASSPPTLKFSMTTSAWPPIAERGPAPPPFRNRRRSTVFRDCRRENTPRRDNLRRVRNEGGTPSAGVVAASGALDLDYIGAEIGQELSGPRAGEDACELENAKAAKRRRHAILKSGQASSCKPRIFGTRRRDCRNEPPQAVFDGLFHTPSRIKTPPQKRTLPLRRDQQADAWRSVAKSAKQSSRTLDSSVLPRRAARPQQRDRADLRAAPAGPRRKLRCPP